MNVMFTILCLMYVNAIDNKTIRNWGIFLCLPGIGTLTLEFELKLELERTVL